MRNIIFGCLLTGFFSQTLRADLIEDIEDIESTKSTPPVVTESPAAPTDQVSDSVQNQKAPPLPQRIRVVMRKMKTRQVRRRTATQSPINGNLFILKAMGCKVREVRGSSIF